MTKHGKKYDNAIALLEADRSYTITEALELVKKTSYANFDATVELHLRTNLDPRNASQQVRGVAILPKGLGKPVRVVVFAQGEAAAIAQRAGADFVGGDDLVQNIESGWLDFDIAIATPDMMGKVGKLGRILGRRGLMPNPKSGTVVAAEDLPRAIADAKKGQVEFRLDRTGIIHVSVGKVNFDVDSLLENTTAVIDAILKAKPSGAKGQFVKSAYLASTMGPGVKLDLKDLTSVSGS